MALMMAMGELQKFAGPDQRVTANASILETATVPIANRHWMGVWRTDGLRAEPATGAKPLIHRLTTTTGTDAGSLRDRRAEPGYDRQSESLTWLVSTPNPSAIPDPFPAAADAVRLVGSGSATTNPADQVFAPRVSIKNGSYAWWVADDGCKARFNLPPAPEGTAAVSPAWLNPAQQGISAMTGLDQYESIPAADLTKSVSRRNADLTEAAQAGALKEHFHDLSFHSAGVLADTQNGGLRRDLTAFIATGTLAASGAKPAIDINTPILNSPKLNLISAKFGMLKSWNDLAARVDAGGAIDVVPPTAVADGIEGFLMRTGAGMDLARQKTSPVHPVMLDAGVSYGVSLFKTGGQGATAGTFRYKIRIHYYPRLVLWNPYQVKIKPSAYAVQFAMPHKFYIRIFDPGLPGGERQFDFLDNTSRSYATASGPANNTPFAPVFMVPATGFDPGEALLFTADATGADRCTPWGTIGGTASRIDNFRLSCSKALPLQDSFMIESDYSIDLLSTSGSTYQVFAAHDYNPAGNYGWKQYWYKLWQVKGGTGPDTISKLFGNNIINYPPLQYIAQTEDGTSGSDAPWFVDIPASSSERLLETKQARNAFYRFKWGHRFQWLADTNENQIIKPGSYNTPYLEYNVLANHNLRSSWHFRSPVEVCFRASASAGRYTHGTLIDDPYGWDWSNPQLAPVSANGKNRVSPFGAPALFGGQTFPLLSIPREDVPLISMGAFQHVPLSPFPWHPTYAFGNGLTDPRGQRDRTTNFVNESSWNTIGVHSRSWKEYRHRQGQLNPEMNNQAFLHDLSYEANFALWDTYFLSTIPRNYTAGEPLPNGRIKTLANPADVRADLLDGNRVALRLMLDGAFNVNSTSVDAWAALLASFRDEPAIEITLTHGNKVRANDVFSRLIQPGGEEYDNGGPYDAATWNGYRKLDDNQIRALATEIVAEVKQRAPFLSLADFINRRLVRPPASNGAETAITRTGLKGTIQAAIDRSAINETLMSSFKIAKKEFRMGGPDQEEQVIHGSSYPKPFFPLSGGNPAYGPKPDHHHWADGKLVGAPACLSQADILQKLGPVLSARGDTFTIRGYGECRDAAGKVTARAWAEVVAQRTPQALHPDAAGLDPDTTPAGKFGRRFDIISFRWLNPSEI